MVTRTNTLIEKRAEFITDGHASITQCYVESAILNVPFKIKA
jgi:hypothetical protein